MDKMFSAALCITLEKSNLLSLKWISELLCIYKLNAKLWYWHVILFIYIFGFKNELRQQNTCSEIKQIRKEEKQNEKNKGNGTIEKPLIK